MAGRALERMPSDAVDIAARRQQFVPLTIAHLGNAGTATDGFDTMFTEAAQHAAEELGFAETLTPDLRDANFVPGQIAEAALGPTARDYESFSGAKVAVLGDVSPTPPASQPGGGDNEPSSQVEGYPPYTSLQARANIHGRVSFLFPYGDSLDEAGPPI